MLKTKGKAAAMMFTVPVILWVLLLLPVSAEERTATTYFSNGMWLVEIQEAWGAKLPHNALIQNNLKT